jgi:hypothetical protein
MKDYRDKMTLDEMADNDMAMTKDAIKNASRYNFGRDMRKATIFLRNCLDFTLRRLGMPSPQPPANCNSREARIRHEMKIDKAMREKGIRIEKRNNYRGADIWRCGLYIYQRGELVAFISDVLTKRVTKLAPGAADLLKIGSDELSYMVITNSAPEDTKKIFIVPGIGQGLAISGN